MELYSKLPILYSFSSSMWEWDCVVVVAWVDGISELLSNDSNWAYRPFFYCPFCVVAGCISLSENRAEKLQKKT